MKKFLLLLAAIGALFTSCKQETESLFIEVDYSKDLVGTWSCLAPNYAEVLIIKEDGSVLSTGVEDYELWKNVKGTVKTVNNKIFMTFEDGDNFEGRFDIVPGVAFSIYNEEGARLTYSYCKHDISKDVLGVWVCNDTPDVAERDMAIATYKENDSALYTGLMPGGGDYGVNYEESYSVIGNMLFRRVTRGVGTSSVGSNYVASQLTYTPNGTEFGDILTERIYIPSNGEVVEKMFSWLRVKQELSLQEKKYDYSNVYATNISGKDETIDIIGYPFNIAQMDSAKIDQMLKAILFNVEFPDKQTIRYSCYYNNVEVALDVPVIVEGNKMTLDMQSKDAALRNVELYTFQDADDSQMHIYMSRGSFVGFFGNMQVVVESEKGLLNKDDFAAVAAVYDRLDSAVESINLSFIFKSAK